MSCSSIVSLFMQTQVVICDGEEVLDIHEGFKAVDGGIVGFGDEEVADGFG